MRVTHEEIPPVFDKNSRVLILGTIPSPKSREAAFYYAHPQNRFWRVLAEVMGEEIPPSREARRVFCLQKHIALWDVLYACDIEGAADSTIKNPVPNDIERILCAAPIQAIFTTGHTADRLYKKYLSGLPKSVVLPSTSPANCRMKLEELVERYREIRRYL